MKNKKSFGFTLSEVMIALTLIGVVASLTVTNISYSIQSKARLSEFKAAYSKLDTALNIINNDSSIYRCYSCLSDEENKNYGTKSCSAEVKTGCVIFREKFLKNLGVMRECETDPAQEGCLPKIGYPLTGIPNCFNTAPTRAYVLDNSMILFQDTTSDTSPLFALDVNGKKGPNKWGQDLFTFTVAANDVKTVGDYTIVTNTGIYPATSCNPGETTENSSSQNAPKSSRQLYKEMLNVKN